jgi:hypothetical protein
VVVRGASTPPRGGNDRPGGNYRGRDAGEEATVVASSITSGREACGINLWRTHRPVGEAVPTRARGPMGERKEALAGGDS